LKRRLQWNVDQVVPVLRRQPRDVGLRRHLRVGHANHPVPLLVGLDVFPDRHAGAEQAGARRLPQASRTASAARLRVALEVKATARQPSLGHSLA